MIDPALLLTPAVTTAAAAVSQNRLGVQRQLVSDGATEQEVTLGSVLSAAAALVVAEKLYGLPITEALAAGEMWVSAPFTTPTVH